MVLEFPSRQSTIYLVIYMESSPGTFSLMLAAETWRGRSMFVYAVADVD